MHITFKSSYQGQFNYTLHAAGGVTREISILAFVPDYVGGHWNYTPEEFARDVVGALGILRFGGSSETIPAEVFDAFITQHGADFPHLQITRGHYESGRGWIKV